jgi:hypothetical protein
MAGGAAAADCAAASRFQPLASTAPADSINIRLFMMNFS